MTPPLPLDPAARARHKRRNLVHSALVIAGMAGILALSTWLAFGADSVWWVIAAWLAGVALTPRLPAAWIMRLYGARAIPPRAWPTGHRIVAELARRAGLPSVPRLYLLHAPMMNAMTVGWRGDAAIAVTHTLAAAMTPREAAGVLAHEVSHIRNNDTWLMVLAGAMARLVSILGLMGLFSFFLALPMALLDPQFWGVAGAGLVLAAAPTLSALLQLSLSRAREFDADLDGAALTGDPAALATALRKLERDQKAMLRRLFPGRQVPDISVLRSHPVTDERIARLAELAAHPEWLPYEPPLDLPEPDEPLPRPRRATLLRPWG